ELASRDHFARLSPMILRCMQDAALPLSELDAVAWTQGPGLAGALLVGASVGSALALSLGVPGLGIHHLEGHLLSPLLDDAPPSFPFVALLCSGGHTQLMRVKALGQYELLGDTLDDAAGEAFDKSAKMMGLGYPGGPAIAALAQGGNPLSHAFPRPMLRSGDLDFSFSGLKTAVRTKLAALGVRQDDSASMAALSAGQRQDLAASLQAAICEVLVRKSMAAMAQTGEQRLVIAGGVSANRELRRQLGQACERQGISLHFPALHLCTDNGAMIALAAALRFARGEGLRGLELASVGAAVRPRWPLETLNEPGCTPNA
ncbi:MAG: tRNA (adenosine(37)-N6)-threonylcarbamoyltransferase complex transferase subunit TsaD, partial [Betaproteobacteria bacterium]|nr:tRNA (adenosine(37)-N6)-threonylcarbamoyltransferase complex transferase subunit TsaD [Betaproteobacteria bacterium]